MVGWHHQLNGHEFEQTARDSEEQGSLACCSPWGHKESDTTEQLNDNKQNRILYKFFKFLVEKKWNTEDLVKPTKGETEEKII